MTPVAASLLLSLAIPTAPAPKAEKGLPKELIDLIPEDTAGVLVIDVPRVAKSEIGDVFLKALAADQKGGDEPVKIADLPREVELVLISQFLIDKGVGDFCIVLRLREGSEIPKALMAEAKKKRGKDAAPETIGKRAVYSLGGDSSSFAQIDDRTVMMVLALGEGKQIQETRAAAYGERDKPGPRPALRKMLEDKAPADQAVRVYGHHPTKLGHSTSMVLAAFGSKLEAFHSLGEKVVSYKGGIKLGAAAEIELRFTNKDAATATEFLRIYEDLDRTDSFADELRRGSKAVRDGDDVVITARLTRAMIDELSSKKPNK
jgi:hypothetical protein